MRRAIIPNVKIAVIDHEPLTREFIVNVMMYSVNRKVLAFETPEEFVAHLESGAQIDLLIADMELPGMGGQDLLKFMKHNHAQTLYVAMSANPADEINATREGADAFLAKPFMLQDLFCIVQQFVVEGNA